MIRATAELHAVAPGTYTLVDTFEVRIACPLRIEPHADGTVTESKPWLEISDPDEVIALKVIEVQRVIWTGGSTMMRANRYDRGPDHRPVFRDRISVEVSVTGADEVEGGEPAVLRVRRKAELLELPLGYVLAAIRNGDQRAGRGSVSSVCA